MNKIITSLESLESWILGKCSKSTKTSKWNYLTPTIAVLALGVIFASRVPTGMAVGVGTTTSGLLAGGIALKLGFAAAEDGNNEYLQTMDKHPLFFTLGFPIVEEGVHRGILQPLATRGILYVAPTAAAAFAGTSLSIADAVSILANSVIFGLTHLFNPHKNARMQAISTTFSGIGWGIARARFGLPASMAAHIVNNTFFVTLITFLLKK